MAEPYPRRMTADQFFAWQRDQDRLYELVDGVPLLPLKMMTGASQAHDQVAVNIIGELAAQLRRGPCRPTTDNLAVRIPAGNVRRPDVTVECGQAERRDMDVREPRAVVEVLSPSTMSFDRLRKVREYQTIASLAYILLVDTEAPRVDMLTRHAEGWIATEHDGLTAQIALPEIGAQLRMADIFEGLDFQPAAKPAS